MKKEYNNIINNKIGLDWLKQGWTIFKSNAITWILIIITIIVVIGLLNNFTAGRFVGIVIMPLLFGGIYVTLDKFHKGQGVGFMGIFSAIKNNHARKQLFFIGIMGIAIIALSYVFKNMPGSNLQVFSGNHYSSGYREYGSLGNILTALVNFVWAMALSLATPLVCLGRLSAVSALKLSLKATIANMIPLTIYFLLVVLLIIVAILPAALGLFVAIPVIFCANYVVYDSLFNRDLCTTHGTC